MFKKSILIATFLFTAPLFSQIKFESGYFINNNNEKVNCLVRNVDWESNPVSFDYKLSEESKVENAGIETVKEFGIGTEVKFIRATVNMDKSSDVVNELSDNRNPVFVEETIFFSINCRRKSNLVFL